MEANSGVKENDLDFLQLDVSRATSYRSQSQIIRVLSEDWVARSTYCPNCGQHPLTPYKNNSPVADFHCGSCREEYELKSQKHALGRTVVDGAHATMMERLKQSNNPNLLLLNYNQHLLTVTNVVVIPKHFFSASIIEVRKPLAQTARRAGWVGCNIVVGSIPASGRIFLVQDAMVQPKAAVMALWQRTLFLRDRVPASAKGWLLDVMRCVEEIGADQFQLADVYAFEDRLRHIYPGNKHIRAKIRQQLQVLRDNGFIRFGTKGRYTLTR